MNENQHSENIDEASTQMVSEISQDNLINNNSTVDKYETNENGLSNGLENFGLQEEGSFELFEDNNKDQNTSAAEEKETEEDELEIPAFLRRQKN